VILRAIIYLANTLDLARRKVSDAPVGDGWRAR